MTHDTLVTGKLRNSTLEELQSSTHVINVSNKDKINEEEINKEEINKEEINKTDESFQEQAARLYADDRLLEAARLLRQIPLKSLTSEERSILQKAQKCEGLIETLKQANNSGNDGWKQFTEQHVNGRTTTIQYKMDKTGQLHARFETPVEESFLIPLLSVLNETELYATWFPNWNTPRVRVKQSRKLQQTGRASQVILVNMESPWPLSPREVVLSAVATDDIDENGDIAIRLESLHAGNEYDGLVIPPPPSDTVRVDFEGGFLFRKCPPEMAGSREKRENGSKLREENLILVSFSFFYDAKASMIPDSIMNFIIRVVLGKMWNRFLKVAQEVQKGKRLAHKKAIEKKRTVLYDWVEERVRDMLNYFRNHVHTV